MKEPIVSSVTLLGTTGESIFKNQNLYVQKSPFHSATRHLTDFVVTNQESFYRDQQYFSPIPGIHLNASEYLFLTETPFLTN